MILDSFFAQLKLNFPSLLSILERKNEESLSTTFETKTRFCHEKSKLIGFLWKLIDLKHEGTMELLCKPELFSTCFSLLELEHWNNYLHSHIEKLILKSLESKDENLIAIILNSNYGEVF